MTTIGEICQKLIRKLPFVEEALADDLINISSLARKLKPEIEKALHKDVQIGAVAMAIKRLSKEQSQESKLGLRQFVDNLGDFIVRSGLMHYTFENSKTLALRQRDLIESIANEQIYHSVSQGIFETTIVVSNSSSKIVEKIFVNEKLIFQKTGLSSVTLRLPLERSDTTGFFYYILKNIALENINIEELISTTNEFTIVVRDKDIDRAFSVLMRLKKD